MSEKLQLLIGLLFALSVATALACTDRPTPALDQPPPAPDHEDRQSEVVPVETPRGVGIALIEAGGARTCALTVDRQVICWGGGKDGLQNLRAPLADIERQPREIAKLSVGATEACALTASGRLLCWTHARDATPEARTPLTRLGTFTDVSVGSIYGCGVRTDGSLRCWDGPNPEDRTDAPDGKFLQVATGLRFVCAIRQDGAAACWRPDGAQTPQPPPQPVAALTAGYRHACAITADQRLLCWGSNDLGQTDAPPGQYTAVSAGSFHTCAITTQSALVCWGHNARQQASPPDGAWDALSSGSQHTCALSSDATAHCWGSDLNGQMEFPHGPWIHMDSNRHLLCAVAANGRISCFKAAGESAHHAPAGAWRKIAIGNRMICMLDAWGRADCGGLRRPLESFHWRPYRIDAVLVDLSGAHQRGKDRFYALDEHGHVWGWADGEGFPVRPSPTGQITAVSVGGHLFCFARASGVVDCQQTAKPRSETDASRPTWVAVDVSKSAYIWGVDAGPGSTESIEAPTCAISDTDVLECWDAGGGDGFLRTPQSGYTAVSVGANRACAIARAGNIVCWTRARRMLTFAGDFTAVSVSEDFTCALKRTGGIACWGHHYGGDRTFASWPADHQMHIPGVRLAVGRYERPNAS